MEAPTEWVTLELWTNDDESIGWKIVSRQNSSVNMPRLRQMMLEAAEWMIDPLEKNPVCYSMFMQKDGLCHTRQSKGHDFSRRRDFVALRANMYRSHWLVLDNERGYPHVLAAWWSLSWLYHKLRGHFKQHQKLRRAAGAGVPATPAPVLSDISDRPQPAYEQGGKVVPLRAVRNQDDIRPL